jgi:predicted DNA-binding mobile mystery protein A
MNYWNRKLIREQLDSKLQILRSIRDHMPAQGWIRALRDGLGMSAAQMGKKVGLDQSRIARLEKAEVSGDLKLSTLRKIADGLNMDFVYAFVPKESLEAMIRDQARRLARERLSVLNHTMRLEQQELSDEDKEKMLDDMIQKILIEDPKELWDQ